MENLHFTAEDFTTVALDQEAAYAYMATIANWKLEQWLQDKIVRNASEERMTQAAYSALRGAYAEMGEELNTRRALEVHGEVEFLKAIRKEIEGLRSELATLRAAQERPF